MKLKRNDTQKNNNKQFIVFNISIFKKYIFIYIIILKLGIIYCEDKNSDKKGLLLLLFLVVVIIIIIVLLIIFIVKCCKKRREENRNEFFEGSNYLERGNPEEIQLRQNITINGTKVLSDFLKDKLISDVYNKKFELIGNQCPICLDNFEENKSVIIMGGCLHIFHQKCLGELAEKIDLNRPIFSQLLCPTCRNNLMDDIEKIKICINRYPNFFNDIYQNKKLTKIKHIKNLISSILGENISNIKENNNSIFESNIKINENNNETNKQNIKDENKDISDDSNKFINKEKINKIKNNIKKEGNMINNNNINNEKL